MTQTAAINRSAVMTEAWGEVKGYIARRAAKGFKVDLAALRRTLSLELSYAWSRAKMNAYHTALAEASKADRIHAAMNDLQNKDRWTAADYAAHEALCTELRGLEADERRDEIEKRDLIESAKGRICAVTFTKKDGTERTMKVQPTKLKFHVKDDRAAPAQRKAASVRKARHPHLMPVWDVEAQAPRSVNLATVTTITVDGMAHAYS